MRQAWRALLAPSLIARLCLLVRTNKTNMVTNQQSQGALRELFVAAAHIVFVDRARCIFVVHDAYGGGGAKICTRSPRLMAAQIL
jgi:hypothetical protein